MDCGWRSPPAGWRVCIDGSEHAGAYAFVGGQCVLDYECAGVPLSTCSQGRPCSAGPTCFAHSGLLDGGAFGGSDTCTCDGTGHYACVGPVPPPLPTGCVQRAACSAGSSCVANDAPAGCRTQCTCDTYGELQCATSCTGSARGPCDGIVLPNFCDACPDGTTACSHFVELSSFADAGDCEIASCTPVR